MCTEFTSMHMDVCGTLATFAYAEVAVFFRVDLLSTICPKIEEEE